MSHAPGAQHDRVRETTCEELLTEPLLDAKAAADLLSVRPSWIYEATRTAGLPHVKVGRHIRFLRCDLERWVIEHRRGDPTRPVAGTL